MIRTRSPQNRPPSVDARGPAPRPGRPAPKLGQKVGRVDRRLALCSALVLIVFGVLGARVVQLQLVSGDYYQRQAVLQSLHKLPIGAERGTIFDREGRDLALSVRRSTIYADPTLVNDPAGTAAKLAPILHVDEKFLLKQLSSEPSRFAYLAHTVDDATAMAVRQAALPGIGSVAESARSYPAGGLAGALVGHVGTDGNGLDGAEYLYDGLLRGRDGEVVVEQDPDGHDIPNTQRTHVDARRGTDIVLTIDQNVQWEAEYALLDQVQATHAKGGIAAVVDVTNGDVLAMATVHGATPTSPAAVAVPGDRNGPLTELFEPGSTTKLVTLSWAIEHHKITPDTMFTVPTSIKVDAAVKPYLDEEWHPVQRMTTADILRKSSNVGTIEIASRMHNQDMANAVRAFGLDTRTAIDWPGQPNGLMLPPSQYYATGKYATSIGYGVAVTGMQMLGAFTTIANNGVTRPAHLLDATIDSKGARHAPAVPRGERVVSQHTARDMTTMLDGVVSNGTGACAAIPGYPVAGKTGTSKKLSNGTYSQTLTTASFIGFAPSDHPRFAAIVVLDEPATAAQFGGAAAAPVWSEMMQFALLQYGVPPTDPTGKQFLESRSIAKFPCSVPHGAELARVLADQHAQTAKTPTAAPRHAPGSLPHKKSPRN